MLSYPFFHSRLLSLTLNRLESPLMPCFVLLFVIYLQLLSKRSLFSFYFHSKSVCSATCNPFVTSSLTFDGQNMCKLFSSPSTSIVVNFLKHEETLHAFFFVSFILYIFYYKFLAFFQLHSLKLITLNSETETEV